MIYVLVSVSTLILLSLAAGNSPPLSFCQDIEGDGTPGQFINYV